MSTVTDEKIVVAKEIAAEKETPKTTEKVVSEKAPKKAISKKTKEVLEKIANITKEVKVVKAAKIVNEAKGVSDEDKKIAVKEEVTYESMGLLPEALLHTLKHMGITSPTPVQKQAVPLAIEGRDILGSAQTGTGKTAAFGIPLVKHLMEDKEGTALVMTPTRELATQVMKQLEGMLGRHSSIKTALLIGGASMSKQFQELKRSPRVIVGTPGRIYDHLDRRSLNLEATNFLVLDETDRMLDMGFTIQIDSIIEFMPSKRQTLLFSATLPKNIVRIADKYLTNPARVEIGNASEPAKNIKHEVKHLKEGEKYSTLLTELDAREGSVIIFVKTKRGADELSRRLYQDGHSAEAIHGDLRQHKRDRVIAGFRKHKYRILVATDVAARGLDIPHIEHVINHDLPQCAEDYIHRIGRTARAGAKGNALAFVTPGCRRKWDPIDRMLNPGKARSGGGSRDGGGRGGKSYGRNDGGFGGRREGGFGGGNREGGRREGGYGRSRDGGFGGKRDSGFGGNSDRREGGFGGRREGGFGGNSDRREGGRREGGYGRSRDGGFGGKREGGFGGRREGGFGGNSDRREGGRREGGFGGRREGGFGGKRDVKRVKRKETS